MTDASARPHIKGMAMGSAPSASDVAALPLPDLIRRLHSAEIGLSAADAAAILEAVGPNRIETARSKTLLTAVIERFSNPLVLILLFAATVSALTGDLASFVIIAIIVLISVILDVTQERQAQNAAEKLSEQVALSARVIRGSRPLFEGCRSDWHRRSSFRRASCSRWSVHPVYAVASGIQAPWKPCGTRFGS